MTPIVHDYICFKFYEGWREIEQLYKKELGSHISPQVTYVLQVCSLDNDRTINNIAADIRLNTSAVSTLIARMETRGLVKRTHDTKDRRVVNVRLTQEGHELLGEVQGSIDTISNIISEIISPDEKKAFFNIVSKIVNHIKPRSAKETISSPITK